MSRPRLSVPIQLTTRIVWPSSPRTVRSVPGRRLRAVGSICAGSLVARKGAISASTITMPSSAPPSPTLRFTRASVTDPRIEEHVREVDEQVDEHVDDREEQDHRLHRRVVAREDGVHREPPEPGNAVDGLGDDDAADQPRDAEADARGDRP